MFTLPTTENVEKYDGVSLVKMQDEATLLTSFLPALYDPSHIPSKRLDAKRIETAEGMLLLATKYRIDSLRERIIETLEADYPTMLGG
ncbi:hypothetical protein M422DRAFT_254488 [Sphaerobolus stellatus SS14]|uniref:Uncharacterized protein n=1 Tax=Sphaerobolus stellatus (strain SS14) TaxID=990650 RepID=A0A0C9UHA5_SPHS4|nr:hypothetical protein M422DRAFT_254488 [Sphaerobolus stellatus SS14]